MRQTQDQFSSYSEAALDVIALGLEEANRLGLETFGTESLLLGLFNCGRASVALGKLTSYSALRTEVAKLAEAPNAQSAVLKELPFTKDCRYILEEGVFEKSVLTGGETIQTEHLLLAILDQPVTTAVQILQAQGVDIDQLKKLLIPNNP